MTLLVPDKNKRLCSTDFNITGKRELELFNSVAYFKFNFDFLEQDNFGSQILDGQKGLYSLGLFMPLQKKLTKEKQKLLK